MNDTRPSLIRTSLIRTGLARARQTPTRRARTRLAAWIAAAVLVACAIAPGHAQRTDVKADLLPETEAGQVRPGGRTRLTLKVRLPQDIHVQSNKPRDKLLIPTTLTLEPPAGVRVEKIVYPVAVDLKQEGLDQPLAVYGNDFSITVYVVLAKNVKPGEMVIAARLRYQPCDEVMCYPPARAETEWTLRVG